ncbi:MAG: peptidyl-prolyl cis-trans isomerase, partial [Candidatus Brocadiae bacterium]|nr:peptidyl-prolyl cis-trans isomerase [Candidatus Brocadiia bacterium]
GLRAVQTLVDWALVEQEARRRGITVTDAELVQRKELEVALGLRAVSEEKRMGPEEFRLAAGAFGWDLEGLPKRLEEGISANALRIRATVEKLLAPQIDLGEDALRAHFERTRGKRFAAAHVAVRERREAEYLLVSLQDQPALWPGAVLRQSMDRLSVPHQGRMRPVAASSDLGGALEGMPPGELKLYQDGGLWHVLRFIETIPASDEEFDQVKDRLRAELLALRAGEQFNSLLAFLNRDACVVVNLSPNARVRRLLGEETAAFVNGEPLPVAHLAEVLVQEFGEAMLAPYVERVLITQEAHRRGMSISGEEFDARMQAISEQLFDQQTAGRKVGAGVDVELVKKGLVDQLVLAEDVRATLLAEKLVADGVEVSEEDILAAYDELRDERLVIKELAAGTAEVAERMYRQVRQGTSFELVARTETRQPGVWVTDGLLRTVTSSHPYYAYVKDLKEGRLGGVFEHDGKYRIIRLLRRHSPSEPPPLESMRQS